MSGISAQNFFLELWPSAKHQETSGEREAQKGDDENAAILSFTQLDDTLASCHWGRPSALEQ